MWGKHLAKGFFEAIVLVYASFIGAGFGVIFTLSIVSPESITIGSVYYVLIVVLIPAILLASIKSWANDRLKD